MEIKVLGLTLSNRPMTNRVVVPSTKSEKSLFGAEIFSRISSFWNINFVVHITLAKEWVKAFTCIGINC